MDCKLGVGFDAGMSTCSCDSCLNAVLMDEGTMTRSNRSQQTTDIIVMV